MAMNRANNKKTDTNNDGLFDKLVFINRVTKVVKGGKNMSFAAIVVVGDKNGKVGFGTGKAIEVATAVKKAGEDAKKNMIKVALKEGRTIHSDVKASYGAGKVVLRSAQPGTGIIAGGPMRAVFEMLGVQDIVAKSLGTSNPHNMIRATFKALENTISPKSVADRRGLKVNDVTKKRDINLKLVKKDEIQTEVEAE